LVVSSGGGGDAGAGMMVKVRHSGVQIQEFLSAFPPFESLLRSLLSSYGSVFLLNDVIEACR
jgi:hypothetical protein